MEILYFLGRIYSRLAQNRTRAYATKWNEKYAQNWQRIITILRCHWSNSQFDSFEWFWISDEFWTEKKSKNIHKSILNSAFKYQRVVAFWLCVCFFITDWLSYECVRIFVCPCSNACVRKCVCVRVCVCMTDRMCMCCMAWHGMAWYTNVYRVWVLVFLFEKCMAVKRTAATTAVAAAERWMAFTYTKCSFACACAVQCHRLASPRRRQRQKQKYRNMFIYIGWWFTSYERCIHIHIHIRVHIFVSYNNNNLHTHFLSYPENSLFLLPSHLSIWFCFNKTKFRCIFHALIIILWSLMCKIWFSKDLFWDGSSRLVSKSKATKTDWISFRIQDIYKWENSIDF